MVLGYSIPVSTQAVWGPPADRNREAAEWTRHPRKRSLSAQHREGVSGDTRGEGTRLFLSHIKFALHPLQWMWGADPQGGKAPTCPAQSPSSLVGSQPVGPWDALLQLQGTQAEMGSEGDTLLSQACVALGISVLGLLFSLFIAGSPLPKGCS